MKKYLTLVALTTLAAIFSAHAVEVSPYIGGLVGSTSYTANSGNTSSTQSAGIGFGVFGGLALSHHIAIDGAYTSYGKVNNSDAYLSSLAIYLKGMIPLSNQFNIFGKLGFANISSNDAGNSNTTGSGFAWALGAGFNLSRQLAIIGQYQADTAQAGDSKLEPSMWSLGLKYNF